MKTKAGSQLHTHTAGSCLVARVQDMPGGQGVVSHITHMIPQVRTDRRKVKPVQCTACKPTFLVQAGAARCCASLCSVLLAGTSSQAGTVLSTAKSCFVLYCTGCSIAFFDQRVEELSCADDTFPFRL